MESWWIWKTRLVSNMEHMSESNNGMEWMVNPFSITLVTYQKSIQHMIQNDLYNNVMLCGIVTKCMRGKWFTIKGRWFWGIWEKWMIWRESCVSVGCDVNWKSSKHTTFITTIIIISFLSTLLTCILLLILW